MLVVVSVQAREALREGSPLAFRQLRNGLNADLQLSTQQWKNPILLLNLCRGLARLGFFGLPSRSSPLDYRFRLAQWSNLGISAEYLQLPCEAFKVLMK